MKEDHAREKMISIWTWVGLVLLTYGALILGAGLYYLHSPHLTVLGALQPRIWWGGIMLTVGVLFLAVPGKRHPSS